MNIFYLIVEGLFSLSLGWYLCYKVNFKSNKKGVPKMKNPPKPPKKEPRWIKTNEGYVNIHHDFSGELKVLLDYLKEDMRQSAEGILKHIDYVNKMIELKKEVENGRK